MIDEGTKIAVEMDIGHIDELYGEEGLKYAQVLLAQMLEDTTEEELDEIPEPVVDTFRPGSSLWGI